MTLGRPMSAQWLSLAGVATVYLAIGHLIDALGASQPLPAAALVAAACGVALAALGAWLGLAGNPRT